MSNKNRCWMLALCVVMLVLVPACGGGGGSKGGGSTQDISDPVDDTNNSDDGADDGGDGSDDNDDGADDSTDGSDDNADGSDDNADDNSGTDDNADNGDDTSDDTASQPTIPATEEHPAYAVNVVEDQQGNHVIAINSELGEAAFLFFEGGQANLDSLAGVIYQTPDGQLARISFNADGSPRLLETDEANYVYSNYTGTSISVRVEYADGTVENYDNLPIDSSIPALSAVYARALDRHDIGFMVGIVGTSLSVTFCIAPAITGVGTLLTVGCLNAMVGTVGTVLGSSEVGAGSSAGDLLIGYFGNDKGAVVTGIMGAVSGLLGWQTELTELEVAVAGMATSRTTSLLVVDGGRAEARAYLRPKAGTGGTQSVTLSDMGGFSFPTRVKSGSYTVSVEAKGYLTESFTLAVSGGRVAVSTASDLPDAVETIVYDASPADISVPALVYLPVEMDKSPHLLGRIVWPRKLADGSEVVEIVEGGLVTLMTTGGDKAAFHTADYVDSGGFAPGGEAGTGAGGNYDIWLPRRHGTFKLEYSGTHSALNPVNITVDRAASIVADIPKTGHLEANTVTRSFGPEDISLDIPVKSRYDGRWLITATPSIASYNWTYQYENDEGETVIESGVETCEGFTVNLTLDGGAGEAVRTDDGSWDVAIEYDGTFAGDAWGLAWTGNILRGGSYQESSLGDEEVGCYGTYSSQYLD